MLALAALVPYATFLTLGARAYLRTGSYENRPGRAVKFASVVLLALLVWWPASGAGEVALLRFAFAFIVLGDLFFGVLRRFVAGVAMFAVVQIAFDGVFEDLGEGLRFLPDRRRRGPDQRGPGAPYGLSQVTVSRRHAPPTRWK